MSMSDEHKQMLQARIEDERARTSARIEALERDFRDIVESSADAVRDDEHDAEGATIAFERAQVASLLAEARARIGDLDQAGKRLESDEAGLCDRCGDPIGIERLEARPTATLCVSCAERA